MISRRTFLCGLTLATLAVPLAAAAQPPAKIPRIGYLGPVSPSAGVFLLESELCSNALGNRSDQIDEFEFAVD